MNYDIFYASDRGVPAYPPLGLALAPEAPLPFHAHHKPRPKPGHVIHTCRKCGQRWCSCGWKGK